MKNIILLFIVVLLGVIYINVGSTKSTSFSFTNLNIKLSNNEAINSTIEEYIVGVVAAEMPASFELEALKAQAVASRTFLYYKIYNDKNYTIEADKNFQAYITKEEMKNKWSIDYEKYYNKILRAVNETSNIIITYEDKIIKSYYFSMSNGKTENVKSVFNEDYPYLKSVNSYENNTINNYEYLVTLTKNDFLNMLGDSSKDIIINNIIKDETDHVETIVINNKTYSGIEIRKLLNLRSTDFTIEANDNINIITKGYGHDVGMSQYGANILAKQNYSYEEIIKHYYTNVKLNNILSIKY